MREREKTLGTCPEISVDVKVIKVNALNFQAVESSYKISKHIPKMPIRTARK